MPELNAEAFATPESEYLQAEEKRLAELTTRLATKETEFATTQAQLAKFAAEYLTRFAPLYAEVDRLQALIARLHVARNPTDATRQAASAAADRAAASRRLAEETTGVPSAEHREPSRRLRDLFRGAALKIHPDLADDDDERQRRTAIMAALNDAYQRGDEQAIRDAISAESSRPEAIRGDDVASRLVRVIRQLAQVQRRFQELVVLSERMEADPLFELFNAVREEWLAGADPLAEDEMGLRAQITELGDRLRALEPGAP